LGRGLDWVTHRGPFQPLTFWDSPWAALAPRPPCLAVSTTPLDFWEDGFSHPSPGVQRDGAPVGAAPQATGAPRSGIQRAGGQGAAPGTRGGMLVTTPTPAMRSRPNGHGQRGQWRLPATGFRPTWWVRSILGCRASTAPGDGQLSAAEGFFRGIKGWLVKPLDFPPKRGKVADDPHRVPWHCTTSHSISLRIHPSPAPHGIHPLRPPTPPPPPPSPLSAMELKPGAFEVQTTIKSHQGNWKDQNPTPNPKPTAQPHTLLLPTLQPGHGSCHRHRKIQPRLEHLLGWLAEDT